jgi:hypothetical protein
MDPAAVLQLCGAVRDALPLLGVRDAQADDLLARVAGAVAAVGSRPMDPVAVTAAVKMVRHRLMEVADGPVAAMLADSAARIIGDDVGRLFS